jgi:uncharacterized protein
MSDKALFLDTLFIQATLNRRDQYHQQAQLLLPRVRAAREVWTTEAILIEVGNAMTPLYPGGLRYTTVKNKTADCAD